MHKVNLGEAAPPKTTPEGERIFEMIGGDESVVSVAKHIGHALVEVDPGEGSPKHHHERTEEVYHILQGRMDITVDDEDATLGPDDAILISPGQVHKYANGGSDLLRFLVISGPPWTPDDMHLDT